MRSTVQHAFNSTADGYDCDRSRLIPGFDAIYRWAIDLIPPTAKDIVDLGAGTGLLSKFVRTRFPEARLHLIDISEAMLAKARDRFSADTCLTFQVADFSDDLLPQDTDAFVSAMAIHHLADDAKQRLFKNTYIGLKPGGVFINAEQVLGPTPELEDRYKAIWLEQVRLLGASEKQIAEAMFRQQADISASVEDQLAWMRSAGYIEMDCWYKNGRFAVLAGRKATSL
jgi:tRNA (cmo5U34)-methyltransferase